MEAAYRVLWYFPVILLRKVARFLLPLFLFDVCFYAIVLSVFCKLIKD